MSLTTEVSPKKLQLAVMRGFKRLENFRMARIHFLKQYTGPYYDRVSGEAGEAAINLIFNAVRVLVPTMVMNFPKHTIETPYLAVRQYAELLGLALDQHDKKIDIANVYRRVIVDAIFTLGILKTGLAQSDSVYAIDDETRIDPGTVYTEAVDFDNFVVDPNSREHMFRDAMFMGDRITVPRQMLLDSGLYQNDLIERLPRSGATNDPDPKADELSKDSIDQSENAALEDDVEIVELWVPSANAIVTVPGTKDVVFDDYLRVDDYYGVKEGPYTLLALTPPVPNNPLPIPMVGVWHDLHILANRMAKKVVEQAERQKTIIGYKRSAADDAAQVRDAGDGEGVAMDDPDAVREFNLGGQQNSNERQLESLENWFNMMAGNPSQVGGQNIEAKSATAANLLQQNAGVGLEDMKDMVYKMAASEARKRAWYFHTDPLMQIPLIKRQQTAPGSMQITPQGQWLAAPNMQEVQVILTPEARSGDFMDFVFAIQPESMGRVDSKVRIQQEQAFCQQIMPAVMTAAQLAMSMGIPFDAVSMLIRMAKDMGITWLDEVLYNPQFQMQMQQQMMAGPQAANSKGQLAGPQQPNNMMGQMLQNGQPSNVAGAPEPVGGNPNAAAQTGANDSQRLVRATLGNAFAKPQTFSGDPSQNAF